MHWKCLILAAALGLTACTDAGGKGDEGPNGGDRVAQQAASMASEVVGRVAKLPQLFPEVNIEKLREVVRRTRIIVRDRTFANGVETDAINNGVDLIEINAARWETWTDHDRRLALLFHELLGLMGLEKNSYDISSRLLTIENRFAEEKVFVCGSEYDPCLITMRYDQTSRGFIVRPTDGCSDFPRSVNVYRFAGSGVYSTHSYCTPAQPGESSSCSARPGSGLEWDTLQLMDGYEFYFSGVGHRQLICKLRKNEVFTLWGTSCADVTSKAQPECERRYFFRYREASACRGEGTSWTRDFTCE